MIVICLKNPKFLVASRLVAYLLLVLVFSTLTPAQQTALPSIEPKVDTTQYWGATIQGIQFSGVTSDQLIPLNAHLALKIGDPLSSEALAQSIRQLFATGLYQDLEARITLLDGGVLVNFFGQPRRFIGSVTVTGAKTSMLNAQLTQATGLNAGTRFTETNYKQAVDLMQQTMVRNGFHQAKISSTLAPRLNTQLVDLSFQVIPGPQARVGQVAMTGDAGMTVDEFRRAAHLKLGSLIDHDTKTRALAGVLNQFRKQNRLEAEIKLISNDYDSKTNQENYQFSVNRGPVVNVLVNGAKLSDSHIRRLIPVFEEGSVDEDLLMEGNRTLRDYYQRKGYFSAKVDHLDPAANSDPVVIQYTVHLGQRSRVSVVNIIGNHYFDTDTLKDRLSVRAADAFDRQGIYSQALLNADVNALRAIYINNGFSDVSITPLTTEDEIPVSGKQVPLKVNYNINEGPQQRVASVQIEGAQQIPVPTLLSILNTAPGQPLSPQNLAGDRDALITYYLDKGYRPGQCGCNGYACEKSASASRSCAKR